MLRNLAIKSDDRLSEVNGLVELGQAANHFASQSAFEDYRSRRADNTIRRQDADLALFAEFIQSTGVIVGDLSADPEAWRGVTWGLVAAFQGWQLGRGYSVGSVNVRLSTIKTYAKLAFRAGVLGATEYALIRAVEGYSRKESKRVDEKRAADGIDTRIGDKKAGPVAIRIDQAAALKSQPDTPQGRRDALILCLLLDHGLRVGEVAGLTVDGFNLDVGILTFYRPKVDRLQSHKLTGDTWRAAVAYLNQDGPAEGCIWRRSIKGGALGDQGMSDRAITDRVKVLGADIGIDGLSAHDCRHYWATMAARSGTPVDRLQDAGGWSSPAMPLRYIEAAKISNQGVLLE